MAGPQKLDGLVFILLPAAVAHKYSKHYKSQFVSWLFILKRIVINEKIPG